MGPISNTSFPISIKEYIISVLELLRVYMWWWHSHSTECWYYRTIETGMAENSLPLLRLHLRLGGPLSIMWECETLLNHVIRYWILYLHDHHAFVCTWPYCFDESWAFRERIFYAFQVINVDFLIVWKVFKVFVLLIDSIRCRGHVKMWTPPNWGPWSPFSWENRDPDPYFHNILGTPGSPFSQEIGDPLIPFLRHFFTFQTRL